MAEIKKGSEIIWECLIREGVEVVFGYPGGAILPTYDALNFYPQIHHVLVRHVAFRQRKSRRTLGSGNYRGSLTST